MEHYYCEICEECIYSDLIKEVFEKEGHFYHKSCLELEMAGNVGETYNECEDWFVDPKDYSDY